MTENDPYAHCPELRGLIKPPEQSFFRDFTAERLFRDFPQMEEHRSWPYPDPVREALRRDALAEHDGDLWVFAYGSLMWDPAFHFAEVRHAMVKGFQRRMILQDWRGARGTRQAPGLMASLDIGHRCEGLAFRIAQDRVEAETENLFRREMIAPGYHAVFVDAQINPETVPALTFVADHSVDEIMPDLSREQQIEWIAQGQGFLGTSRDYLANIVSQFAALGIEDAECAALLRDVDARIAGHAARGHGP
ncbi:gamma-glutamylcyclotransferase [Shimia ponticola]|uniref:gamma-glutamylcyclotransferase n=1 Tax=Shimia ponticola TaxID=2582893 RepID=UPI0011BDA496|nr:gamma-glutamylcyclotransferase [Shimia ponticola]